LPLEGVFGWYPEWNHHYFTVKYLILFIF
jgi:hypothetical protein